MNNLFTETSFIEKNVINLINKREGLVKAKSLHSPRTVGDALESLMREEFTSLLPNNTIKEYFPDANRRAMGDLSFTDYLGNDYKVDIKTHNLRTKFNMPNLTSVKRLADYYKEDNNYFVLLLISYKIENNRINCKESYFVPIEYVDWNCLTLGNLGWGQLQLKDSNNLLIDKDTTRQDWLDKMNSKLNSFYKKELKKLKTRMNYFK